MNRLSRLFALVLVTMLAVLAITPAARAAVDSNVTTMVLPFEQQVLHGATHVVKITHAALTGTTTNATAQTLAIWDVADKIAVQVVKSVLKTAFEDTATAAYDSLLIEIGDGGDTDRLSTSCEINDNGTQINQKIGTGTVYAYTSSDTVDAKITPKAGYTGAQLNAGEIWIYLKVHDDR